MYSTALYQTLIYLIIVAILTYTLKGYYNLLPNLQIISNNTAKPTSKQLDTSYASRIIILTASQRKPSRGEYSFYYYTNIFSISNYLISGSLLISCQIILNNNLLKYLPYLIR